MSEQLTRLPIMEAFHTIQGEGAFSGRSAYFIRVAGCDVGCVWCDVKESWDAGAHPEIEVDKIAEIAGAHPSRISVVTGGEPLMYDMGPLTRELRRIGFRTHLETSGAYPLSGDWHWICFSPKKFRQALDGFHPHADELKVIVANKHDFEWAEQHAALVRDDCVRLLQPEWSKEAQMLPLIVDYVKANPEWQISLQTHKYMNIP